MSMKEAGLNSDRYFNRASHLELLAQRFCDRIPISYWSIDVLPYGPYIQSAYLYLVRTIN